MKITAGKFVPIRSPVHGLSPSSKMLSVITLTLAVILSSSVSDYLLVSSVVLSMMILSRVGFMTYLRGLKSIMFLIIFAAVVQLLYSGIVQTVESLVRITLILLVAEVLTFTTRPVEIAHSLEDIMKVFGASLKTRQEFSMIMMIAVRFAPVMLEEVDRITKAQIARGAKIDTGRIWDRMKFLVAVTVPLMASAVRKSEEIALAMEVRRYKPGTPRTRYRVYGWGIGEWLLLITSIASIASVVMI